MNMNNNATVVVTEFILLGLTDNPTVQVMLFVFFLMVYSITLVCNMGMVILINIDPRLHTPMYFFVSSLSFLDICYSSVIAPNTLINFIKEGKVISLGGCAAQMFLFIGLGTTECFLLAAMAYDRYVAICNPLLYPLIMCPKVCVPLVAGSYTLGLLHSLVHTYFTFSLSFCGSNEINHFFCAITPLLALSCSGTHLSELLIFNLAGMVEVSTILSVLVSYAYILATVLRIRSAGGRNKAFSTCASHLTVVMIFHGTILLLHFRPSSSYSLDQDKVISVFYTMVTPMLNPLIYGLRNKEVKAALRGFLERKSTY
ncbi:olfactory receptor 5T17-like [Apteryx mantelli]|uniref:Olfactory receptor n=1 Tax=Apteryx mantelli TaxID=2696672 RepID=A0A8B7J1A5_9AVES